ncbi:glycosyltransferase family protein [Chitinophaga silvisoli]|nr:glycosyltransferase family 4 protein [Chitinophaga silvisoli]
MMCPPQTATGGPELLHQLVSALSSKGFDISIYYVPVQENPVHENYLKYNCKFVTQIEDDPQNILIIPEALLFKTKAFKHIRKCVWWLSIDNLFKYGLSPRFYQYIRRLGGENLFRKSVMIGEVKGKFDYHIAQSYYAIDFLDKHGIKAGYLSDYLNTDFLQDSRQVDYNKKLPQVLYNPKKGIEFTKQIMAAYPEAKWIPLIGLKPAEVAELLKASMVYIDFGEHPGKDRFPREAAIYGCCVITGRKGSAANAGDVPIPEQYKIEDSATQISTITNRIKECCTAYSKHVNDFEAYRQKIYDEERVFIADLDKIFQRHP